MVIPAQLKKWIKLEPELLSLFREAAAHHADHAKDFCANAVWYGYPGHPGIKPRFVHLAGFHARGPEAIRTAEAYDECYRAIYRALPDCRGNCACMALLTAMAEF